MPLNEIPTSIVSSFSSIAKNLASSAEKEKKEFSSVKPSMITLRNAIETHLSVMISPTEKEMKEGKEKK